MGLFEQLPYTNFHDLNLTELIKFVNDTIKHIHEMDLTIEEQNQAIEDFKKYVLDYLNNLNVEQDVRDYIDQLISGGIMTDIIRGAVNDLHDWSNRNIIFCGDSYGRGLSIIGGVATYGTSWVEYCCQMINPNMYYNQSVNQASFADTNSEARRYGYQLKDFVDNHTTTECESITDIVICGGYNEIFDHNNDIVNTTANYCANWTANYIKTNFPNARVFIGFIGRVPAMSGGANATIPIFTKCIKKYKAIATKYNWTYLNNIEFACHNYDELSEDGIHFTSTGYMTIGHGVADCLNNGVFYITGSDGASVKMKPTVISDADNIQFSDFGGLYNIVGETGVCLFSLPSAGVKLEFTSRTLNCSLHAYAIGRYIDQATQTFNKFASQYGVRCEATARVHLGGTVVANVPCSINFRDDGIAQLVFYGDDNSLSNITADSIVIIINPITLPLSFT